MDGNFSERSKKLFKEKKPNPVATSTLVEDMRRDGLNLSAEKVLLQYVTKQDKGTKALGWNPSDYLHKSRDSLKQSEPPMLLPHPDRRLSDLSVTPDLSLYSIPKFRAIHYREEATSRFHDKRTYESHVGSSQLGEDMRSSALFDSSSKRRDSIGRHESRLRAINKQHKMFPENSMKRQVLRTENKLRKRFGKEPLKLREFRSSDLMFTKMPLAEDLVDTVIQNKWATRDTFKKTAPKQSNLLQFEEQLYVNQMDKYDQYQKKRNDIGNYQISTTDNPLHAAKYGFGEKFTTERQSEYKKFEKSKRKDLEKGKKLGSEETAREFENTVKRKTKYGGPLRRTSDTVGKLYTSFHSPEELYEYSRDPLRAPPLMTTTIERRNETIALQPNQAREMETTFFTKMDKRKLALELPLKIPQSEQVGYKQLESTVFGSKKREKFSELQVPQVWKQADEHAKLKKKILIPHGTFDSVFGQSSVDDYQNQKRKVQEKALEDMGNKRKKM